MITIVCGTNRQGAVSKSVCLIYQNMLRQHGAEAEIIDLAALPSDFAFSALYENSGKNEAFNQFRERMVQSEKFVFVVAEYNGSFPGVLKTFIDGLKFPDTFKGKKCALVGISAGVQGAGLALSHLTDIFNYCGTHVLAQKPKLAQIGNNMEAGKMVNSLYIQLLEEQIIEFLKF